ncbi:uncharacterized protein LOC128953161 [Oppia nitens]|uniref:uncharacterized protein LOC128953161 n=1 Tax=Oppia nitens TaxID=1686743 RepID=UPI0023DB2D15|nr:uncharacterized protein LOC128953161 [Oppia nitens]
MVNGFNQCKQRSRTDDRQKSSIYRQFEQKYYQINDDCAIGRDGLLKVFTHLNATDKIIRNTILNQCSIEFDGCVDQKKRQYDDENKQLKAELDRESALGRTQVAKFLPEHEFLACQKKALGIQ